MSESELKRSKLEATTLRMFSVFFGVQSLLVLAGTFWALEKTSTIITSISTGLALAAVSVGAYISARAVLRRAEHRFSKGSESR